MCVFFLGTGVMEKSEAGAANRCSLFDEQLISLSSFLSFGVHGDLLEDRT
jgi:hypothetical protein